jgi:hypothetical protein
VNVKDWAASNTVVGFVVRVVPYVRSGMLYEKVVTGNVNDDVDCVSLSVTKFGYVLSARVSVVVLIILNLGILPGVSSHSLLPPGTTSA